jgi:type VI secretion system secreted protein VgrG
MPPASVNVELQLDGLDEGATWVMDLEVEEGLSEVHPVRVTVETRGAPAPEDVLDKPAAVLFELFGSQRRFQGVVVEAALEDLSDGVQRLEVLIAPRLALLGLGRRSRIFQDADCKTVLGKVLDEGGVKTLRWSLQETHPKRAYVMQHQESDLAFIERLLAEEGIAFAFQESDDGEELVLFDTSTKAAPMEGESTLQDLTAAHLLEVVGEGAWDVRARRAVASDAVVTKDYDLRRPKADLTAKKEAERARGREVYLHPGGFLEEAEGKRRARARLEELRTGAFVFEGKTSCPRLQAGRTFSLQSTPHALASIDHLAVRVRHRVFTEGEGDDRIHLYENAFSSIPADVPWRPPRKEKPVVRGPQLAVVTAPSGEEIHCDDYGRVKVRFLWDQDGAKDDKSSTWLRVGQVALGGALVLPRQGFEVMVDFEQGDIDRPFVAGHLYNGEAMPPYELPGDKTRSTFQSATTSGGSGANELRFEDSAGAEEVFFNASKDFVLSAPNDAHETVGNDRTVKVGASRKVTVGQDHRANVASDRKLTVAGSMDVSVGGSLSDGVGGSETVTVGGTRKVDVGGDETTTVKGNFDRKVAALEAITAIVGLQRTTVGSSTVTVGAAWAELVAGSRKSACGGNRTETTGAVKLVKAKGSKAGAEGNVVVNAAGAYATKCGGGRSDTAGGAMTITAAGAFSVKATNINIEAKAAITIVAGGSVISLTSGGIVTVMGGSIKVDGEAVLPQPLHNSN